MASKAVHFITADDDFIAANRAREIFEELSADVADDMSKEIVDGAAGKVDEAVSACAKTIEAAATLSMFGGGKVVWLKGLNFVGDSVVGKSASVKEALEKLADFLETLTPDVASVVISAYPVDRRKPFYKKLQTFSDCEDFKSKDPLSGCVDLILRESRIKKIAMESGAAETLASIVAGNPRMALSELEKLAVYVNGERPISERDVVEMVPIFGEGSPFDLSNAFYSGDLDTALAAIKRYFFANKKASARPIISMLQNQNSILIQLRSLMDGGILAKSTYPQPRGAIEEAAPRFAEYFDDAQDKSNFNVFTQNPWYVGTKLAPIAGGTTLKKLIDRQMYLAKAFEDLITRPNSDETVIRDMFVLCMSK